MRIADAGRGIPPDEVEQVFLLFLQIDSAFSRSSNGPGLPLSRK